eukprot:748118-Hanusia_phi.AAC.2
MCITCDCLARLIDLASVLSCTAGHQLPLNGCDENFLARKFSFRPVETNVDMKVHVDRKGHTCSTTFADSYDRDRGRDGKERKTEKILSVG